MSSVRLFENDLSHSGYAPAILYPRVSGPDIPEPRIEHVFLLRLLEHELESVFSEVYEHRDSPIRLRERER